MQSAGITSYLNKLEQLRLSPRAKGPTVDKYFFNSFRFIEIFLILFPLCLFWTYIYFPKKLVLFNLNSTFTDKLS